MNRRRRAARLAARGLLAGGLALAAGCSSLPARPDADPAWALADGPYGGPVNDLAASRDGTLYAATDQGLFRRVPGDAWQRLDTGAREPSHTRALGAVAAAERVQSLAVDGEVLVARTAFHLLRSRDGGDRFTRLDARLERAGGTHATDLTTLARPAGEALFLGTRRTGLLRSTDDGQTWHAVLAGDAPPRIDAGPVAAGGRLYVAASSRGAGLTRRPHLFRSESGRDWHALPPPAVAFEHLAGDGDGNLIGAGWRKLESGRRLELHRATDGARGWTRLPLPVARLVALSTAGPDRRLHALGEHGLHRLSTADTWQALPPRSPARPSAITAELHALAWHAGEALVAAADGVYCWRADDSGWRSFVRGPRAAAVEAFAVAGRRSHALAGGTLHRSDDQGRTWRRLPWATGIRKLAVAPDGRLFLATADDLVILSPAGDRRRLRLPEGGLTGMTGAADGSLLLYSKRRIFRLAHGDIAPVAAPTLAGDLIGTLQAGPDGLVLAALVERGPYRSLDNGRSWRAVPAAAFAGGQPPDGLRFHLAPDGTAYAYGRRRVFRSRDRGASWQSMPMRGLTYRETPGATPEPRVLHTLASASDGTLLAGTRRGGVYRWQPRDRTWRPRLTGLTTGRIEALAVTPAGRLLAATPHGVFHAGVGPGRRPPHAPRHIRSGHYP